VQGGFKTSGDAQRFADEMYAARGISMDEPSEFSHRNASSNGTFADVPRFAFLRFFGESHCWFANVYADQARPKRVCMAVKSLMSRVR
jgi:hypothetical protein